MSEEKYIEIKGARVNNLKNISLKIPRDQFIVIAGVSGSGKSSLAFDTLYAEGQRRYVESLSSYARQFLGRMRKPECDFIKGLPPAIAIEQKVIARNPRSTVGTSTEIYEYLRLLYARIGRTYSPASGQEVKKHTAEDVIRQMEQFGEGTRFVIMSPLHIVKGRTTQKQLEMYVQEGYSRIFTKGDFIRIDDFLETHAKEVLKPQEIYLVIDRMSVSKEKDAISRLTDSAETAFYEGDGYMQVMILPSQQIFKFSTRFEADGIQFEEPTENLFSFNSPLGACPTCEGFGSVLGIDERLVIPNSTLSVYDGCVQCWHGDKMNVWQKEFIRRGEKDHFPVFKPYYQLSQKEKDMLWHGLPSEKKVNIHDRICIDSFFQMVKENQYKIQYRVMMSRYRGKTVCPTCHGTRLKKEASYVKIGGRSITDLVEMSIWDLKDWFDHLALDPDDAKIAKRLLVEIRNRLQFLVEVGLGYLTLNRRSNTLSGGESQRINLTTSLGSSLVGSLYILDEPSIGLHPRDTDRLIHVLKELQDIGNTVIVVEHDEEIIRSADELIDIGPDAGRLGGEVVFQGRMDAINEAQGDPGKCQELLVRYPRSYTIKYLTGTETIPVPASRRNWNRSILLKGCRMNNLRGIDVRFPLNVLTVVTGVSGSGKSSLVKGILYPAMKRHLDEVCDVPGEYLSMEGDWQMIKHVEFVDQNPIGKSTRSNPATYVKAYDAIRELFAEQPLARQMGFTSQYFSFNTDGGRCEVCKGAGVITVEMQFMADLTLECEACHGQRFKHDVLEVRFHEKNINDVLNMTVSEAIDFFGKYKEKAITDRLKPLEEVGLGYIKLGQNSSTLSGGENQRVKLAYFISQEQAEPTLFIFDEPTTGLHFHDIKRLLSAFDALLSRGHTVIVIEHNLDVIKCADHVIDLGPDGGNNGGNLVIAGTPEEVAACGDSITGVFLKKKLEADGKVQEQGRKPGK
ncbi:MAG: excinuclease ABC subunit UvrA [Prevotella sp.]|jgi:excinuclease ABC subunit A|nr:excinuclease ABC subunit UvrA [Prevotella sp.]MCI1684962.1 excinuclease ABC subunit UvrA [Prevotella sp.]MCI1781849.1 excinuclease ABC subunit UvrA [Prevotella sp.]MCI1802872.1 excinuclease ABC subunit UvrA [Prevotella sp.]MCI1817460.1 excinuclease ABC subunit UvrA [Prevotella sp.]MCI1848534.1 excinuclease ABC subunit UvrA [Prevotella sp.]